MFGISCELYIIVLLNNFFYHMGKKTKQKIVETTIGLLNERGYRNTKLKDIADKQKISLGNLTYHFHKKDDLIRFIFDLIATDVDDMFASFDQLPTLENFDQHIRRYYALQGKFKFFYTDRLEFIRDFHDLRGDYYRRIEGHLSRIKYTLMYNVGRGILQADFSASVYDHMAEVVWKTMTNYHINSMIREGEHASFDNLSNEVWKLLLPFFTRDGLIELVAFKDMDVSLDQISLDQLYGKLK